MKQNDLMGITVNELLSNYVAVFAMYTDECVGIMLADDIAELPDKYFYVDIVEVAIGKYLAKGEVLTKGDLV